MTEAPDESLKLPLQTDAQTFALMAELQQRGIKHTPEKIVRIAKLTDGKIVFLESGNSASGLKHIVDNHRRDFFERGISEAEIPDALMTAVLYGNIVGYQSPTRPIYQVNFNSQTQLIAVTISSNGYLVCANPSSLK